MRKMKDSGIEWIGEIPEEWSIKNIGQLYTERKQKVSDKEYAPLSVTMKGILPQLSTAAKTDAHDDRKLVKVGDFAINSRSDRRGSCGISAYDGSVSLINTILKPRKEMNPVYYNWLFHTSLFSDEYYKWGHGIVDDLWTTNWQDMKRIGVPVPNLSEQTAIAAYLDRQCTHIDNIIEKTKTSIEEYKKLKQAVITQAVTKGIRGNREMKDSGIDYLGEIPINWSLISISKAFNFIGGYAYKSELFCSKSSFQVVRIGNVRDDKLLLERNPVYIDSDYAKQSLSSKIKSNDILFSMTGTKGKKDYFYTVLIDNNLVSSKNLFVNQRVGCFRQNANICMKYYCYLLKVERIKDFIFIYETGTANQGNLGIETINRTKLFLPPIDEQQEIAAYLDQKCSEIDAIITKKQQFITEMENYKKSLIFELVLSQSIRLYKQQDQEDNF